MTGRDDHQMAVENTISKRIEGKPAYVRSYYLSMQYPLLAPGEKGHFLPGEKGHL